VRTKGLALALFMTLLMLLSVAFVDGDGGRSAFAQICDPKPPGTDPGGDGGDGGDANGGDGGDAEGGDGGDGY
jgi:hypothetical protein